MPMRSVMPQRSVEAGTRDLTSSNVARYTPWDFDLFGAEAAIFDRFLRPGMLVLDLGCGNGRVGRRLAPGRAVPRAVAPPASPRPDRRVPPAGLRRRRRRTDPSGAPRCVPPPGGGPRGPGAGGRVGDTVGDQEPRGGRPVLGLADV